MGSVTDNHYGPPLRAAGFRLDAHGYPMCDRQGYHRPHTFGPLHAECGGLERGEFDFGSTPDALSHPSDTAHMDPAAWATPPTRHAHDNQDNE